MTARGGPRALGLTWSSWRRAALQVVPGVLNTDVFKLGRVVDAKSHQDDIPSGSQLNLPLWLVESLATMILDAAPAGGRSARFFVDVQAPNAFSPVAVEDMHADAGAARIRSSTRYYYDVGMKLGALGRLQRNEELMQIVEADTEGEGSFLVKVFKARFCSLLAEAHIVPEDTRMKMQNKLTREEFDRTFYAPPGGPPAPREPPPHPPSPHPRRTPPRRYAIPGGRRPVLPQEDLWI